MAKNIKFFLMALLNTFSIIGLYIVVFDLTKSGTNGTLPNFPFLFKAVTTPYFLGSLPICSILMLLGKSTWKKILGLIYLMGTIGMLYLFGEAWV